MELTGHVYADVRKITRTPIGALLQTYDIHVDGMVIELPEILGDVTYPMPGEKTGY